MSVIPRLQMQQNGSLHLAIGVNQTVESLIYDPDHKILHSTIQFERPDRHSQEK